MTIVTVSTGEAAVPVRIQYSAVPIQRGCGGEGWRHRLGTASSHWRAVRARLGMQSAALGSDPQVSPVPVPELVCAGHSPVRRGAGPLEAAARNAAGVERAEKRRPATQALQGASVRSRCASVECLIEGHGEKVSCCMVSPQPRPPHRLLLTSNGRRNASGLGVTMPISAPLLPRFLLSRSR